MQIAIIRVRIPIRDNIPCFPHGWKARDQKEVREMSKYEIAVVLSAKLEDEERAQIIEKIKGLVERYSGSVTDVKEWGKKKLAYEIQKMSEAFYYFVEFETENTDCPNEMEQQLRIMDGVIRYLVVAREEEE